MYALARALTTHRKVVFLTTCRADQRRLQRVLQGYPASCTLIANRQWDAENSVEALLAAGCDLFVLWQTALSMEDLTRPGELMLPTRIIDAESDERYDTALVAAGRRDRTALLSTADAPDTGTRRRLAMKFQCLVLDRVAAPLARRLSRARVDFFVVCTLIDTRADYWTNRMLEWHTWFSRRNPLRFVVTLVYKPREFLDSWLSRQRAAARLRDTAHRLEEALNEASGRVREPVGSID